METKDKKILAITSGAFLSVLALILFFTFQSKDNMMSNNGRYNGSLGDAAHVSNCASEVWSCPNSSDTVINDKCYYETTLGDAICSQSGGVWQNSTCYMLSGNISYSCTSCKQNFYADGSGECAACPEPYSTSSEGSTLITHCFTIVPAGQQLIYENGVGTISSCPSGKYRSTSSTAIHGQSVQCLECDGTVGGNGTTCTENSSSNIPISRMSISGDGNLSVGESKTFSVTVEPTNHTDTILWSSSNDSVATVNSSGRVTGVSQGTATITAYSQSDNSVHTSIVVTVSNDSNYSITCEDTRVGLTGNCTIANGNLNGSATSSNDSVATVYSTGSTTITYTGVGVGSATITATINSTSVTSNTFHVTEASSNPITNISVSGSSSILIGETRTYTASVTPSSYDDTVLWRSSDTSIAVVANGTDAGKVTGYSAGTVTITAYSQANHSIYDSITVTVNPGANCSITATSPYKHVSIGETAPVIFNITGSNCGILVDNITMSNFTGATSGNAAEEIPYTPTATCDYGTVTGCIKGTNICSSTTVSIYELNVWKQKYLTNVTESTINSNPSSADEADKAGVDVYYTNCTPNSGSTTYSCDRYTRGCGTSGGDTPTETSYCWKYIESGETDNRYQNSTSDLSSSGWIKVGETGKVTCGEDPYCYTNNGEYYYGKYSGRGYTKTSLSENDCKKETPTPKSYCWMLKGSGTDNQYQNSTSDLSSSGWVRLGETGKVTCGETAYCYVKDDGTYDTGKFYGQSGYTYYGTNCPEEACYYNSTTGVYRWTDTPTYNEQIISSIKDETTCEGQNTPPSSQTPDYACYYNATLDDYDWTDSPKSGYTITTINDPIACDKSETPACYLNLSTNQYEWGLFESYTAKYRLVPGISDEPTCLAPNPACYKDQYGQYDWGLHDGDGNYTLVTSISKEPNCKADVVVPPTSSDITMIVYVSIIVLTAFGIGFIAYTKYSYRKNS